MTENDVSTKGAGPMTLIERMEKSWMAKRRWSNWCCAVFCFSLVVLARLMKAFGDLGERLEDYVWPWSMR